MLDKIAFLCVTPLEGFLMPMLQSSIKEYYQWLNDQALIKRVGLHCREWVEKYGENGLGNMQELFDQTINVTQLLYVQSNRKELVREVFERADLVIMGLPGCKREFDKIFLSIFPWKDRILFFWDKHICRGEDYIRQICNEYKLKESQLIEVKRNLQAS